MNTRTRELEKLQDWQGWINEFQNESDRAAVVLGVAVLDALLEELLRAFLVEDSTEVDHLLGVDRPLGSFGARGRAAYCLGFKHIVRLEKIRLYSAVNLEAGYKPLQIYSPREVSSYDE